MTVPRVSIAAAALAAFAFTACAAQPDAAQTPASGAPSTGEAAAGKTLSGTVAETIGAADYIYIRLQTGEGDVWLAAPGVALKTGERITAAIEMTMDNFHSQSLNRDFPRLYFAGSVTRDGKTMEVMLPAPSPALMNSHGAAEKIEPPAGGMSIADVWAKRASLARTTVLIRGTVVKVNNAIMERNWFHVQDGSGAADKGTNDLTITSSAEVKPGDVVTVSGTLAIDKDFGAGYTYAAIIEGATVTKK